MPAILVLFTFMLFVALDCAFSSRAKHVRGTSVSKPDETSAWVGKVFFHPGHSWARPEPGGLVTAGSEDLAANFAGSLSAIKLPQVGTRLQQGDPAWTLLSTRGRSMILPMPVEGEIVEVNPKLGGRPQLVQEDSYRGGWVVRIRPRALEEDLVQLVSGHAAEAWRNASRSAIKLLFGRALGTLAADGGELVVAFGDRLEDADWEAVKNNLFSRGGVWVQ